MKRLWTTLKYRLQQRRIARKAELRRRRGRGKYGRGSGGEARFVAPSELSLFDRPEDTLRYCNELRAAAGRGNTRIFVDLSNVTRFSSDALFVIRAIMDGKHAWRTNFSGNLPLNPEIAAKIKATGFFSGFAKPPANLPPPKGLILRKSHRKVHSDVAAELVRFAQNHATISREMGNACSHMLIEAMTNTRGHAGEQSRSRKGKQITQPWSAGVYCEEGAAHFTFADLGIGILRSAPARRYLKKILGTPINSYGRQRLLQDAFLGVIGSSTGLPGRGLGLPDMKGNADAGLLPNLMVLTDTVIGRVSDLNFSGINEPMRGTVLRWRAGEEQS